MSILKDILKDEIPNFIPDLRQSFRDNRDAAIEDACIDERNNNIAIATIAMLDGGLSDEVITRLLQEYWDLRLSETKDVLEFAHDRLAKLK